MEDIEENIENKVNKNLNFLEVGLNLYSMPDELKDDFEIKKQLMGNDLYYDIAPKTKDALKKFPPHINFSYNNRNKTKDELEQINKLKDIITGKEHITKPFKILNPDKISLYFGKYKDPLSPISRNNYSNKIEHYIMPIEKKILINLKVINGTNYRKEFKNITLVEEENTNTVRIFNSKDYNLLFNLVIEIDKKNKKIKITIKNRFSKNNDSSSFLDFYQLLYYFRKKDSRITITNNNGELITSYSNKEKNSISKEKEKKFEKEIKIIKKIIYIEDQINVQFNLSSEDFLLRTDVINLLYNYLIVSHKRIISSKDSIWYTCTDKVTYENIKIGDKIDSDNNINLTIQLFQKNFNITNSSIVFEQAKVVNKLVKDNKYFILIHPKSLLLKNKDNNLEIN